MSATITGTSSSTVTCEAVPNSSNAPENLVLHLSSQPVENTERPHVSWTTDTVDNEMMHKKKSKCCCIYKKPKNWQDSSSDSDSDCETGHCRGHVEKRKPQPNEK